MKKTTENKKSIAENKKIHKEEKNRNKQLRKPFVNQFYKKNKVFFLLSLVAAFLMSTMSLAASWLIQQLIDTISGVEDAKGLGTLTILTGVLVLAILVLGLIEYVSKPRFMKKAMTGYKNYAFEKLTQKSINSFHDEATAMYISALSNDANSIEVNYLEKNFDLISNLVMFIGAFLMMLIYSPMLTGVVVLLTILPLMASLLVGNRLEQAEVTVSNKNESFLDTLKESIGGFSVVKSFKAEKAILQLFTKNNSSVEDAKYQKRKISIIIGIIGAVAGVIAQLGVFLAGAYFALSGNMVTPGVVIAFVNLMNFVIGPIGVLPEIFASRKASLALIEKLAAALNDNVRKEGKIIPKHLKNSIKIEELSFGYQDGDEILHNLNYEFEAGKSYALVGASGSGKTTLLNLLLAAHEDYSGKISFDGQELRDIDSESLYDLISVIQQNVVIFNASIRDNITMFQDVEKSKVDQVIEMSGLKTFMEEHGEDYLCGENGNALSGGEKQRISIARSLLRQASVLLVDEATAALDAKTAYQVSKSILEVEDLTRIVVTHSLEESLLRQYDEILVLKSGKIVETGKFQELMGQKGYFYSLYTVSR